MQRSLSAAAVALSLAAMSPAQDRPRTLPYPVTEPDAYRTAVERGTRSASGAPGAAHWTDRVAYRIRAELDPATATLRGHVDATYTNRSPEPLSFVWMHLRQNLHREGAQRTRDVVVTGGMQIENLTVDGESTAARVRGTRLPIRLPNRLATGESATVSMDFSFVVPPAGGAPRMGHEDNHVFYLGYWYPQFAVRDDVEDWVCEEYRGNGEFYMPYGDYDLRLTAPSGWLVRATGALQNAGEVLSSPARAALEKARTSREIQTVVDEETMRAGGLTAPVDGPLVWHFVAEDVRDVAVSISDRYVWEATHAVVPGRDEPVMIHAVYEPESSTWPVAAEAARFTIEWMSREVYPYPWPHMTACEGVIGGGMEYPMMTICGDSSRVSGVQGVIAHELIHMWFPMIVGSNEKRHAWQDEGTTSFFTDLVTSAMRDTPQTARNSMLGYIRSARRGGESPMMTGADFYPTGYGFASYTKPAALLHQLRALLQDGERDVFMEAIRRYVADWAYKHPTPFDMWRTLEDVAGRDLDWYWQPWYFEVRKLDHAVGAVLDANGGGTVVRVEDRGFCPMPCRIRATLADGTTVEQVVPVDHWLAGNTVAMVSFPEGVVEVRLDPSRDTLDIEPDNNVWKRD